MRLSVTDVDSYRYYKAEEDMDAEGLIRRLLKQEPPSQAMLAGRALHKVLETAGSGEMAVAEAEGFKFHFTANCEIPLLPVRELKGEIQIATPSGIVTLVGVIDGLDWSVYDHKLTARFDAERYADSYQWRCYLLMFSARRFVYNVFEGREGDSPNEWVIHGFQQFPLYAYGAMRDDVHREVAELAEFVAQHVPQKMAA